MVSAPFIRITKEFPFEMAHVLCNYDGPCRNVHGHSYRLFVTVKGVPVKDNGSTKNGMVMDFTELKRVVTEEIISVFDHTIVIAGFYDKKKLQLLSEAFNNVNIVDYQPTCENLVSDFAARLVRRLSPEIKLFSLKLYETATSYAEWFAEDN